MKPYNIRSKTNLLILLITCLGLLFACSSSNRKNSDSELALVLAFLLDEPLFLAFQDGDDKWVIGDVSDGMASFNVKDADGRYTFAAYGMYRGVGRGYYVESTLDDAREHNIMFDDTDTSVTFDINYSFSNSNFGSLWAGTDFINNQVSFSGSGTQTGTYSFTQATNASVSGDVLAILNQVSMGHRTLPFRMYSDSSTLSYTATPADVNTSITIDHSAIKNDSGYLGTGLKFSGINLKAQILDEFKYSSDTFQFEVFPVASDKIFAISSSWEMMESLYNINIKYSSYDNAPRDMTISESPAAPPAVTISQDLKYTIQIYYPVTYDSGLSDVSNVVSGALVNNWRILRTPSRYQMGAQHYGFDAEVLTLSGFPSGVEPIPSGISKVSFYESNRSPEFELNFLYSGHKAAAENSGMFRNRVNLNF